MIFVVGILTGISLCIAGIVLRRTNRNGDLGVLVYIGEWFKFYKSVFYWLYIINEDIQSYAF